MPILNKQPAIVKTRIRQSRNLSRSFVERYAAFIQSTPDYVVNSALTKKSSSGKLNLKRWEKQQQGTTGGALRKSLRSKGRRHDPENS